MEINFPNFDWNRTGFTWRLRNSVSWKVCLIANINLAHFSWRNSFFQGPHVASRTHSQTLFQRRKPKRHFGFFSARLSLWRFSGLFWTGKWRAKQIIHQKTENYTKKVQTWVYIFPLWILFIFFFHEMRRTSLICVIYFIQKKRVSLTKCEFL